jgi:hypothetical protein
MYVSIYFFDVTNHMGSCSSSCQQIIHSVLACRMVLDVREWGQRPMTGNDPNESESPLPLRFNTKISEPLPATTTTATVTIGESSTNADHIDHARPVRSVSFGGEHVCWSRAMEWSNIYIQSQSSVWILPVRTYALRLLGRWYLGWSTDITDSIKGLYTPSVQRQKQL